MPGEIVKPVMKAAASGVIAGVAAQLSDNVPGASLTIPVVGRTASLPVAIGATNAMASLVGHAVDAWVIDPVLPALSLDAFEGVVKQVVPPAVSGGATVALARMPGGNALTSAEFGTGKAFLIGAGAHVAGDMLVEGLMPDPAAAGMLG